MFKVPRPKALHTRLGIDLGKALMETVHLGDVGINLLDQPRHCRIFMGLGVTKGL